LFILIIYISFVIDKQTEKRAKKIKNIYETAKITYFAFKHTGLYFRRHQFSGSFCEANLVGTD